MLIRFGYDITVSCAVETPLICMMSLRDERQGDLLSDAGFSTAPDLPQTTYRDRFGNTCIRLVAPPGLTRLYSDSTIRANPLPEPVFPWARETPVAELPDETLVYLLGSRYCETDRLSQLAWDLFGNTEQGWSRVQSIVDYVNRHIRFDYQQARATRTAFEAWQEGIGVCRDFAHLAIAFCRCMNIPARYVNSYLGDIGVPVVGAMDFSACMEVYLDGRWHIFDPRNNMRRIGRIAIAQGRDAADVPLIHSFGPHLLNSFTVWTDEVQDTAVADVA